MLQESLGEQVDIVPAQQQVGDGWYSDSANAVAVLQNLNSLRDAQPAYVLVPGGGHRRGMANDSLVLVGCIVSGALMRSSILFYGVRVGAHSVVEDSVVLPNVTIGQQVHLRRAIIDKPCVLPDGLRAGLHPEQDRKRFTVTERGINLVTRDG